MHACLMPLGKEESDLKRRQGRNTITSFIINFKTQITFITSLIIRIRNKETEKVQMLGCKFAELSRKITRMQQAGETIFKKNFFNILVVALLFNNGN